MPGHTVAGVTGAVTVPVSSTCARKPVRSEKLPPAGTGNVTFSWPGVGVPDAAEIPGLPGSVRISFESADCEPSPSAFRAETCSV